MLNAFTTRGRGSRMLKNLILCDIPWRVRYKIVIRPGRCRRWGRRGRCRRAGGCDRRTIAVVTAGGPGQLRLLRSPDSHRTVIRSGRQQGRIDRVPTNAVYGAGVTYQRRQRFLPANVPDVNLVVFATAGHETFVHTAKAGINRIITLGYPLETTNETLVLEIP